MQSYDLKNNVIEKTLNEMHLLVFNRGFRIILRDMVDSWIVSIQKLRIIIIIKNSIELFLK